MSRGGALVTGAGAGLGREIALRLGTSGYTVHVTDVDPALAEAVAAELGGGAFASAYDVRDAQAAREMAERTVQQAGSLELWINNAGVLVTGPVWEQSSEQRQLMVDVNVLGTMHGMAAALDAMIPVGRGHIVNIVSLAGLSAVPGEAVYAGTKHAVMGLSLSTMLDLRIAGLDDVTISCVCPDGMWTPMLYDKLDDPGAAMSFSGVLLQPGEVADVVARVVRTPRPVTPIPAWRGGMARALDLSPRLTMLAGPVVARAAVRKQAKMRRKLVEDPARAAHLNDSGEPAR